MAKTLGEELYAIKVLALHHDPKCYSWERLDPVAREGWERAALKFKAVRASHYDPRAVDTEHVLPTKIGERAEVT